MVADCARSASSTTAPAYETMSPLRSVNQSLCLPHLILHEAILTPAPLPQDILRARRMIIERGAVTNDVKIRQGIELFLDELTKQRELEGNQHLPLDVCAFCAQVMLLNEGWTANSFLLTNCVDASHFRCSSSRQHTRKTSSSIISVRKCCSGQREARVVVELHIITVSSNSSPLRCRLQSERTAPVW